MNGKKTTGESSGFDTSSADQALATQNANTVMQNNSQFNGPVTSTPYYQSLLKSGTDSTNSAYDNASRNLKTSMEGAGVSGGSRVAMGNTAAMGAARAGALGTVKNTAIQGATQMQQNANQQGIELAQSMGNQGAQYFGTAANSENQRLARQGSMWNGLLQAGMTMANPFLSNMAKTGNWTGS